ncbi:PAS domain-containing sensor histidine kinase [Piscirickettsia salmonis]|uniref:Phosphate regulon sensor protein PhoR n=1 Tax=Piscirickettsia salmonis TaxID=1238 RepID=A0A9Q6PVX1_PISSA|nr:phosphate regulon sensor histidine kinase PhoR [Piscirickettsia salmonis]ALA24158.1 phosphate regulon sensor kinase PhoR [Piscirickettsia salmonis]APS44553.1 PAS domain-containing sensor histidine kinase [Piscirickettsia salmonis]APS47914.1 PAS domain-containing sensor histidine kinase [Piscirickettsia salmonis]APS51871.1 PAS domain-containing sensor histidine kinase [Piscirickettsia salmonis]APS55090.1 PAS domain-containing sensor histidine kinase [Piscirickettsia salmonis]
MSIGLHYNNPLIASLSDAIVGLDQDFLIKWWNPAARKLLRLKSQHKHQTITSVISHPDFVEFLKDPQDSVQCTLKNNKAITAMLLPVESGERLLVAKDISQSYFLDKMRQDFVANVSHELRTPLTVIHGYLETLIDFSESSTDQKTSPYLHIYNQMQQQTKRMESIVADLLLLSRLEGQAPNKDEDEVIALASILQGVYQDTLTLSQQAHDIQLEIDEQIKLKGNRSELRSAFTNLSYNAVRYTPKGGKISIIAYKNDHGIHVLVKDTGIGVPKKYIQRLTERFYRVDKGRSRDVGGTGLGLAIVKHVLLRHEGELTIKSTEQQGSEFTCSFPLYKEVKETIKT